MGLTVSIVSPVYRAEPSTLRELHRRLAEMAAASDVEFEFVYVDDASPDGTWDLLTELASSDERVTALRLARNVRQTRAIFAGTEVAVGDAIVVMDSDLEDPPEFVPELVAAYLEGHDLVVATRERRAGTRVRRLGSMVMNLFARALGVQVDDVGSSFLIMSPAIEAGVRRELDRSGVQLILPTNVALAERPTTRRVTEASAAPSTYPAGALLRIGAEFVARYAARRLAVPAAGGGVAAGLLARRAANGGRPWRRAAGVAVASLLAASVLALLPMRRRSDRDRPLYEVAEQAGRATRR